MYWRPPLRRSGALKNTMYLLFSSGHWQSFSHGSRNCAVVGPYILGMTWLKLLRPEHTELAVKLVAMAVLEVSQHPAWHGCGACSRSCLPRAGSGSFSLVPDFAAFNPLVLWVSLVGSEFMAYLLQLLCLRYLANSNFELGPSCSILEWSAEISWVFCWNPWLDFGKKANQRWLRGIVLALPKMFKTENLWETGISQLLKLRPYNPIRAGFWELSGLACGGFFPTYGKYVRDCFWPVS